jgi:hypothetical protein
MYCTYVSMYLWIITLRMIQFCPSLHWHKISFEALCQKGTWYRDEWLQDVIEPRYVGMHLPRSNDRSKCTFHSKLTVWISMCCLGSTLCNKVSRTFLKTTFGRGCLLGKDFLNSKFNSKCFCKIEKVMALRGFPIPHQIHIFYLERQYPTVLTTS